MMPLTLFHVALGLIVAVSVWTDVRERRIPNWLSAANLLLGLAAVWSVLGWSGVGLAALHVIVALVVCMILNAIGAIGAGDAKYYASMAAWLPIGLGLWLLVSVSLVGLVLLLVFITFRRIAKAKREGKGADFAKLPYGVAIGVGGLIAVLST